MKIAIFTDTFTPQVNGVARTFQRFVEYLDVNQVEYRLFVPHTKEEELFSSKIHRLTSFPFLLYPECRLAIPNVYSIKKQLELFQPDLIHIATPFNIGLSGLYCGKKLNIPIVGSYHTNFDRYLFYYDVPFVSKWTWKYLSWFHHSFRQTFVPSMTTKKDLMQRGFHNLSIWSRGVDCHSFHPDFPRELIKKQYGINEPYLLTYVGRLAPEKDLDILMEISKQLPDSIRKKVHWLIVGDGPLYGKLKRSAPSNMTFTGYQRGRMLTQIYANSTLFVFPSTTETFGNVVLESLACGTPVIAAKAGGVQEIIEDHKTGRLCEPRNTVEFCQAIEKVLSDDQYLQRMRERARQYALSCSWEAVFSKLLYDYKSVIKGEGNKICKTS